MFNSPVIVIGPPRSGTTTTARVLQDWFGIPMDTAPLAPNEVINKYGFYEDSRLVKINLELGRGEIGVKEWTEGYRRFIRIRQKQSSIWGFKDPRIIPVFNYALRFFDTPTIIRCHRSRELVVNSCIEKLGWEREETELSYDWSEKVLDNCLRNRVHYRINFEGNVEEESIIEMFNDTAIMRHVKY